MQNAKNWFLTCALFLMAITLKASGGKEDKSTCTEPSIQGLVSDGSTKRPVRGVTISIRNGNVPVQVTTDAGGNFKIPGVPLGQVTLILEKKGYKTFRKDGMKLKQGMVITLNPDHEESGIEEGDVFHPLRRMIEGFN